jgi:hypothetical protein
MPTSRPDPSGFNSVPVDQLVERYSLSHLRLDEDPESLVALYEGDLTLENLDLDFREDDAHDYLVTGDLRVKGNITNENTDGARSLVVLGDLHAGNIAIGGQELYVRGSVTVEGVFCGSYNHGESIIDGDVNAGLLIADDYDFHIQGNMRGPEFSTGDGPTGLLEMALTPECLDDDDDLPFNFDTLVERLRQGLPVILPGGLADPTANREKADLFQQAHAAHSSGRWAEAASLYEAAEGAGLPSKPCRYNRALCHYESEDDLGEAIRLFSWCIDQNTHVAECLVKRASARLLQLNEDEDDQLDAKEI